MAQDTIKITIEITPKLHPIYCPSNKTFVSLFIGILKSILSRGDLEGVIHSVTIEEE